MICSIQYNLIAHHPKGKKNKNGKIFNLTEIENGAKLIWFENGERFSVYLNKKKQLIDHLSPP